MSSPDFVTVDALERPARGRLPWRRDVRRIIEEGVDGLRGASVNHANNGTHAGPWCTASSGAAS